MELVDTHAHLDFPEFDDELEEVIARAEERGVKIVNSFLDRGGFERVGSLLEKRGVYFCVGCTPYHPEDFEAQYKLMVETIEDSVGIGEIGLDYYWVKDATGRKREEENFRKFLKLAREYDKPVVIHSRNAEKRALEVMEEERIERAIMHCFSGSLDIGKKAVMMGYLISIPTTVVFSKQKQEFARELPLESIVLETDSPYLAPVKGERNEPSNVALSAEKIAEIRGISVGEVAKTTTRNAKRLFGI